MTGANRMRGSARFAAASLLLLTPLAAAACGDDEASTDPTTTTAPAEPCAEIYKAGDGAVEGPDAVDGRGAPELEACDPEGSEMLVIDQIGGSGAEVAPGATVTVHYAGADAATGTEFDSSWERGEPATFSLDQVIPGWTEGLVGMKEGGRRTLVIPPDLAYGNSGPAPGDYLVFTVDLVSADASSAAPSTIPASDAGG